MFVATSAVSLSTNLNEIRAYIYVCYSRLSWVSSSSGQGFSLEYPHIALHAVSRDLQAYPSECLYILVDTEIDPGRK
jgi:hypothetical protein